jgi:hypothetical protein
MSSIDRDMQQESLELERGKEVVAVCIVGNRVIGGGRTKSSKIGTWVESFQIVGSGEHSG